jgi:hypothetical protein
MSKKKNKFDLSQLVHQGDVKEGQTLTFVSDPAKTCTVVKHISGEYKVAMGKETMTLHAFVQKCLGQEPPDHAAKWVKTPAGKTLFDLWHADDYAEAA